MLSFMNKSKLKEFLKDKQNLILVIIVLFTLMIRIYYFFLTKDQALWWDEAEYMLKAKSIVFNTPETGFSILRPILPSFLFSSFFFLGLGEVGVRIFMLIFSVVNIIFTYLLGKEIFNKKVGLIATLFMSVFYLQLFYSFRVLVDMPSITFGLIGLYCFYRGYTKDKSKYLVWMSIPILVVASLFRFTTGILFVVLLIFLIVTEKLNFIKNKNLWISVIIGFLTALPYLIWSYIKYKNPLKSVIESGVSATGTRGPQDTPFNIFLQYIKYFPSLTHILILIMFFIGLYIFFRLVIGFDLIIKNKSKELKDYFFLFLLIVISFLYFVLFVNHFEDRYVLIIFQAIFYIASFGFLIVYDNLKKLNKNIALILLIIIILVGSFQLLNHSNQIIKSKIDSFKPLKDAGIWINENSDQGDVILNSAVPQNTYYSERETYGYSGDKKVFEELVKSKKPKYMVLSLFERSPQWAYEYPQQNPSKLTPVQAYYSDEKKTQPILVIYKFNY